MPGWGGGGMGMGCPAEVLAVWEIGCPAEVLAVWERVAQLRSLPYGNGVPSCGAGRIGMRFPAGVASRARESTRLNPSHKPISYSFYFSKKTQLTSHRTNRTRTP